MSEFPKDFVWVPCTEWGWEQKEKREKAAQERKPVLVVKHFTPKTPEEIEEARQRKLKVRREWRRKNYRSTKPGRLCSCARVLHANNVTGICGECMKKKKAEGVKWCACGTRLSNRNKVGKCEKCLVPVRKQCSKCERFLNNTNKSGLCVVHSGLSRQLSYRARRKAA